MAEAAATAAGAAQFAPADSPLAGRARELFSECVRAGQWARFTVEQRRNGEYITLLIRPMAVAVSTAAAGAKRKGGRKPNRRRKEKLDEWRKSHRRRKNSKGGSADPQQQQHQ